MEEKKSCFCWNCVKEEKPKDKAQAINGRFTMRAQTGFPAQRRIEKGRREGI